MKRVIILGVLLSVLLVVSCGETIECNEPYILVGTDCCLDKDDNSICDKDEDGVDEEVEEEEEQEADEDQEEPEEDDNEGVSVTTEDDIDYDFEDVKGIVSAETGIKSFDEETDKGIEQFLADLFCMIIDPNKKAEAEAGGNIAPALGWYPFTDEAATYFLLSQIFCLIKLQVILKKIKARYRHFSNDVHSSQDF